MSSNEQLLASGILAGSERSEALGRTTLRMSRPLLVVLWLLMLAVCVWVAGAALAWATSLFDYSEPKLTESLNFRNQQFDIVYFGDSLTLEGVNARTVDQMLGTRSYNLALGGSSVLESEMQLRHFLAANPKPRLVALGLYINQPNRPAGVRPTMYFSLSPEERTLFQRKLHDLDGTQIDRSFLVFNMVSAYRYRNTIDLLLKAALSSQEQRPAFVQGQAQAFFSRQAHLGRAHESVFSLPELRSFIAFCHEQGLPLLLFEPPNTDGFSALTRNRSTLLTAIDKLAAGRPDVWFVSYGDTGNQYPNANWLNLNHLNVVGSEQFSAVLASSLRSHLSSERFATAATAQP